MKAIRVHSHGAPEVLTYEDVPQPVPGPLEALVKLEAAGVNFIDVYHRTGRYPTSLPVHDRPGGCRDGGRGGRRGARRAHR